MARFFYIILYCFFITSASYSQNLTFGTEITPKYTFPVFNQDIATSSKNKFGFNIGANIFLDINHRMQLYSGLHLHNINFRFIDYSVLLGCDHSSTGESLPQNSFYSINHHIYYLGIPLHLKWKIVGESNHIYIQSGLDILFQSWETGERKLHECGTSITTLDDSVIFDPNKIILLPQLGIGHEHQLSKKIKAYVEIRGEYSLGRTYRKLSTFVTEDALNNNNFYNLGLVLGIRFL